MTLSCLVLWCTFSYDRSRTCFDIECRWLKIREFDKKVDGPAGILEPHSRDMFTGVNEVVF